MTFGERIQLLRKQRKMSQEELGEKLEVTRQTISKWELDQSTPDLDYIIAISEFFEVTTDYLIKGGKDEKVALKSQSAFIPAPQLQYCEDDPESGYDRSRYSASSAAAISASSEYFVINIKLNYKLVLRTVWALLLMLVGFMGALVSVSFFSQPLTDDFERIILAVLFLASAAVFITGLSFFAEALLRYHIALRKLGMKIRRFASDFVKAFRAVQLERDQLAQNRICEAASTYAENSEEIRGSASAAAAEHDVGVKKSLVSKKMWGLILAVMSAIGGFIDIVNISHFYDSFYRNPFVLIFELLFLLLALILFCMGIGLISNKRVKIVKAEEISAAEKTADSGFLRGQALNNEALEQRQKGKALKIKEKAEIKAAEIREMYRLRAEAFAPDNEAMAEQIIAKGEAKAARVTEKAEKKIRRYETGDSRNSRVREKGAHLREK